MLVRAAAAVLVRAAAAVGAGPVGAGPVGGGPVGGGPVNRLAEQRAARAELARHIYAQYRPDLVQRVVQTIFHAIVRALERLPATGGARVAGLLALLAVLLFVGLRIRRGTRRGAPVFDPADPAHHASSAELRAEAERLAAAQDFSGAVVARMRALARALEERTVVDPMPGRTARELARRAAAALPAQGLALQSAAAVFDATRYGAEPAGREAYQLVAGTDDACRHATPVTPQ